VKQANPSGAAPSVVFRRSKRTHIFKEYSSGNQPNPPQNSIQTAKKAGRSGSLRSPTKHTVKRGTRDRAQKSVQVALVLYCRQQSARPHCAHSPSGGPSAQRLSPVLRAYRAAAAVGADPDENGRKFEFPLAPRRRTMLHLLLD
jgi:hypothetical protein